MINQPVIAGMHQGYRMAWRLGVTGVQVLDFRMAKTGEVRFLVDRDPRGPMQLEFGPPDIQDQEKGIAGVRAAGCELVWRCE